MRPLKIAFRPKQCPFCSSVSVVKIGLRKLKNKKVVQRFLCKDCGRKFQLDRVRSKYCKPSGCLLALIQRLKNKGYTSRQVSWFFKVGLNKSVSHAFINNVGFEDSCQACGACVFCKVKPEHMHCFMWNIWNKTKEKNSCLACGSYSVQIVKSVDFEKFNRVFDAWAKQHAERFAFEKLLAEKKKKFPLLPEAELLPVVRSLSKDLKYVARLERERVKRTQAKHNLKGLALLKCRSCGRIARLNNYSKDCTDLWSPEKYQSWLIKQLSSEQELVSGLRSWFSTELTEV